MTRAPAQRRLPSVSGDLAARLDPVLARVSAAATPGTQAALLRDGELVWTGTYGVADVDATTPVSDGTVFCLASLGKPLLAALALSEVERGRVALDEPLSVALGDGLPGAGVVTLRMLLTHTSGYPDLYEAAEVMALMPPTSSGGGSAYDPDRPFTWEMLAPALRDPVEPGSHWAYSNTGYIIVAEVLTRVLGGTESFAEEWTEFADAVGGVLPLTSDVLTFDRSAVALRRLAHGYEQLDNGSWVDPYAAHQPSGVPADLFGLPFGDGLFGGTAVGAAVFLDGLLVRRVLLDPAMVDLMTAITPQAAAAVDAPDPDLRTYGMGMFQMTVRDAVWVGHRGSYAGFTAAGASCLATGETLVVLSNALTEARPALVVWRELAGRLT